MLLDIKNNKRDKLSSSPLPPAQLYTLSTEEYERAWTKEHTDWCCHPVIAQSVALRPDNAQAQVKVIVGKGKELNE